MASTGLMIHISTSWCRTNKQLQEKVGAEEKATKEDQYVNATHTTAGKIFCLFYNVI